MTPKRRVIVETDTERDPIAGRIEGECQSSRPFTGWLELIAGLEAELCSQAPQDPEEGSS